MRVGSYIIQLLVIKALIIAAFAQTKIQKQFKIESVNRKVEVDTPYINQRTLLKLKNIGDDNKNIFYFAVPEEQEKQIILMQFQSGNSKDYLQYRVVENLDLKAQHNLVLYEVKLNHYIPPGEVSTINVIQKFYNRFVPLPKQITIKDEQKTLLFDNVYFYSPYQVQTQTVAYTLPVQAISFTELAESSGQGRQVVYGPFIDIEPFSTNNVRLHFENNKPIVVFKKIEKTIEVSHWGFISIDTFYQMANEGAQLTGEYSRIDYNAYKHKWALKKLMADLPYQCQDIYYRDEIGNISTSHAWRDYKEKVVRVEIRPRYTLFGGWKANWWLGYSLPVHHYIFQNKQHPEQFVLKQNFGFNFEGYLAEEYTLKIILPENAQNLKPEIPFEVDEHDVATSYSYLDTNGRPTLIFKKKLVSDFHSKQIKIHYTYMQQESLLKPALLFIGFLILFQFLVFIKRVSFSSVDIKKN